MGLATSCDLGGDDGAGRHAACELHLREMLGAAHGLGFDQHLAGGADLAAEELVEPLFTFRTQKRGALLIFDEMWTGFRFALGGAQQLFDVKADLATFSKAVANTMSRSRDTAAFFALARGAGSLRMASKVAANAGRAHRRCKVKASCKLHAKAHTSVRGPTKSRRASTCSGAM